jgi:hypothetical protein
MTYELQVWLCRQRRIAKLHSFDIFNLGSFRYIVSIKLGTRELVIYIRGCHGRDRIVVGFITIYVISAYHY